MTHEIIERFKYLCQKAVLENSRGLSVKAIAAEIDKGESTLYGELNYRPKPNGGTAKLGAITLFQVMLITGETGPLEFMAERLGYRLTPISSTPDGRDLDDECLQGFSAVTSFIESARDQKTPWDSLGPRLAKAIKELEDVFVRRRDGAAGEVAP